MYYVAGCNTPSTDEPHVIITANSTSIGAIAVYSCDDGYILNGESQIICQENGTWSDAATKCIGRDIASDYDNCVMT